MAMLSPKEAFMSRVKELDREDAFTDREKKKYSFQDRNFVRGIQYATGKTKKEAITELKRIKKDRDRLRSRSGEVQAVYDGKLEAGRGRRRYHRPKEQRELTPEKLYPYKGVVIRARSEVVDRYKPDYSTKARRYTDIVTGEVISRRERDKRIARSLL